MWREAYVARQEKAIFGNLLYT